MILQLNPPIHVSTPKGEGLTLLIFDYGPTVNSIWGVQLCATGAFIHVDSSEIRIMGNEMYAIPDPLRPVRR